MELADLSPSYSDGVSVHLGDTVLGGWPHAGEHSETTYVHGRTECVRLWVASVAPGCTVFGNIGWTPVEADVVCVEGTRSNMV